MCRGRAKNACQKGDDRVSSRRNAHAWPTGKAKTACQKGDDLLSCRRARRESARCNSWRPRAYRGRATPAAQRCLPQWRGYYLHGSLRAQVIRERERKERGREEERSERCRPAIASRAQCTRLPPPLLAFWSCKCRAEPLLKPLPSSPADDRGACRSAGASSCEGCVRYRGAVQILIAQVEL